MRSVFALSLVALVGMAAALPTSTIEKRAPPPAGCQCDDTNYSGKHITAAIDAANPAKRIVGAMFTSYALRYPDAELLDHVCDRSASKLYQYPLKHDTYLGGPPGPNRVIYDDKEIFVDVLLNGATE